MVPITIQVDPDSCPVCERRSPTQPYPPQWLSTDYLPWPTHCACHSATCYQFCQLMTTLSAPHLPIRGSASSLCNLQIPSLASHLRTPLKKPQSLPTQHQPLWSVSLGVLTWYFRKNMISNRVRWSRVGHEAIRLLTWSQQCPKWPTRAHSTVQDHVFHEANNLFNLLGWFWPTLKHRSCWNQIWKLPWFPKKVKKVNLPLPIIPSTAFYYSIYCLCWEQGKLKLPSMWAHPVLHAAPISCPPLVLRLPSTFHPVHIPASRIPHTGPGTWD